MPGSGRKNAAHAGPIAPPNPPRANQLPRACSASGCSPNDTGKADKALLGKSLLRRREGTAHLLPDEPTVNRGHWVVMLGLFGGPSQTLSLRMLTFSETLSVPAIPLAKPANQLTPDSSKVWKTQYVVRRSRHQTLLLDGSDRGTSLYRAKEYARRRRATRECHPNRASW